MIDFRYHLVSLAAVLIALSIGIVLGAGPLNDNIGSTLSGEVNKLRQEKEALRKETNDQRREAEGRDAYDEQTLSKVVDGQLTDRTVTVVALPQAVKDDVDATRTSLEQSGATLTDTVEVTPDWANSADKVTSARSAAGETALRDLGVTAAVPDGAQRVDQALAIILTGNESSQDSTNLDRADREKAWTVLRDEGLVDGSDDVPAAADLVVVLGGPIPAEETTDGDAIDREAERVAGTWVALTHLIETHADGTVLAAAEAEDGSGDASPVTMARLEGNLAEGASTVDVPSLPMGRAAIVLALVQQLDGNSGHYGLGQDADAPVPAPK